MRQTRAMSLVEAVTNVVVGYLMALEVQFAVFPAVRLSVTLGQNLIIGAVLSVVSILRSHLLRREDHNEKPPPRRRGRGMEAPEDQSTIR